MVSFRGSIAFLLIIVIIIDLSETEYICQTIACIPLPFCTRRRQADRPSPTTLIPPFQLLRGFQALILTVCVFLSHFVNCDQCETGEKASTLSAVDLGRRLMF